MDRERKIEIEEVEGVTPPAKARVSDVVETFERKRDYLEGFLAQKPAEEAPVAGADDLYEAVIDALKDIYDPEIPVNIYELGLIYDISINPASEVTVKMTLTSPACPAAQSLPGEVEDKIRLMAKPKDVKVEVVWDPPWTPDMMSEAARLQLGMM